MKFRADLGIILGCGILATVVTALTLGGLRTPAGWHDEAAYLLQAKLFAHGAWSAPSPPLPQFFEQFHVLVMPSLAAKYPPGQALFLTFGVLMGLPGLMVVLAAGATAGLLYVLVKAQWSRAAGVGAVLLWLLSPMALYWRSSYLSEVASGLLWQTGLLLAIRWWRSGGLAVSITLGATVGAMAITRPLTALAFALPLGAIGLQRILAKSWLRDGVAVIVATLSLLLVLPLWAMRTTGRMTGPPLSLYTAQYMPWDRLGFGLDTVAPQRPGPPDMARWAEGFRALHAQYTPGEAVRAVIGRARFVWRDAFGPGWFLFVGLAVVGCLALGRAGALVAVQGATLFALYGLYAHFATWDVYYFELLAPACGLAAIGLAYLIEALARRRSWPSRWHGRFLLGSFTVLGALLLAELPVAVVQSLSRHDRQRRFLGSVASISDPAIVFVKYGVTHDVDAQFVGLLGAPGATWIVHDLGPENSCLAAQAPARKTFQYDEDAGRLRPMRLRTDSVFLTQVGCP